MYTTNSYQVLASHAANFGIAGTADMDSTGVKINYKPPVPVVVRTLILRNESGAHAANNPLRFKITARGNDVGTGLRIDKPVGPGDYVGIEMSERVSPGENFTLNVTTAGTSNDWENFQWAIMGHYAVETIADTLVQNYPTSYKFYLDLRDTEV